MTDRTRALLQRWVPLAIALGVLAFHVAPLWREVASWANQGDARYFWFMIEVDRTTLLDHGQFPLWNPYYCGGAPHLANPQAATGSPFLLPILLFGTPVGFRLAYTLGLLAALLSLRAYARTLGLSEVAATAAGGGYAVCGAFAQHLGGGQWGWMGFALYPLMLRSLHLVMRGRRDHLVWGALALAVIIFHQPIYPLAFAVIVVASYGLFLGLQAGLRSRPFTARKVAAPVGAALAMLALGMLFTAVRLLPEWMFIRSHPRLVKDWDYTWPWELFETYAIRHSERRFSYHQYVFPEYGNYFGWIGVALIFVGLYLVLRRRRALWPVVAGAVLALLLQLGHLRPLPWWALKKLPVYEHLRVPSRFTTVAGMFMCVLIGVVVDTWGAPALARWRVMGGRARWIGAGVLALAVAYLVDAASWNRLQWHQTIGVPPPHDPPAAAFHQVPGNRGNMMIYPRLNEGTLSCFEESPLDISPRLRPNLPADEYLADPTAGTLRRVRWSPNRIVLDVDVTRPATVIVNQNYGPGWRAEGGELVNDGGLLTAQVSAGHHAVTFIFRPPGLWVGLLVSLTSLFAGLAFAVRGYRARPRQAATHAGGTRAATS
jgi:hypothetical protein